MRACRCARSKPTGVGREGRDALPLAVHPVERAGRLVRVASVDRSGLRGGRRNRRAPFRVALFRGPVRVPAASQRENVGR